MGALSELPAFDHNMLFCSVIKNGKMEKSRRSIKDEEREVEKRRFKKKRRRKGSSEKRMLNCREQLVQGGSYLAKLKVFLKCEQVELKLKKRLRKSKYCEFLEREIYYRKRKRGINFSLLIIYSLLNLMQVLAQQYHHQLHNTSPIKVVQAFQPTINDKDSLHFNKHYSGFEVKQEELNGGKKREREVVVNLVGIKHSELNKKRIEDDELKFEKYRPKRLKRNIKRELFPSEKEIMPLSTSEQIVYDASMNLAEQSAKMTQNEQQQQQQQQHERRRKRSIEETVNRKQQQQQQQTGNCSSEYNGIEPELGSEAAKIRQLLSRYYRVESSLAVKRPAKITDQGIIDKGGGSNLDKARVAPDERKSDSKLELPRPSNVSVLIISWYPPILKLSWNLNELSEGDISRLNFYENNSDTTSSASSASSSSSKSYQDKDLFSEFDLELAIDNASEERRTISSSNDPERRQNGTTETEGVDDQRNDVGDNDNDVDVSTLDTDIELARELKRRRFLVRKSLTCFQITYNIINSRFKIIEEYPPYLRSIMLERLLPATEYSLHVVAVYLNRYRLFSERVQFVSPTDNESRRFKEGTYRPIHRYPDEPRHHLRYGLAQVRSEELTIVAIALLFWVATIYLFFNKWGKIRMLEPYQPAYRESSSTTFAVHHHPSIHNMQNCSPGSGSNGTGVNGSGALAGIGAKMGGICGGVGLGAPIFETMPPIRSQTPVSQQPPPPPPPPLAVVTTVNQSTAGDICVGQQQQKQKQQDGAMPTDSTAQANAPTKIGLTAVTSGGALVGSQCPHEFANVEQQQQQRSFDSSSTRKLSRGLLVRGRKRFETVGDEPLVPIKQRTNDELNYLFQTKAQALVRATALWSMKQQQILRQQQLCARLAESEHQKQQQQQQQDEFEMLRRTSQVSSMLRQRHYSNQQQQQQPLVPVGGSLIAGPFCQTQTRDQSSGVPIQRPMNLEIKEWPEIEKECKQEQQASRKQSIATAAAASATTTTTTTGRRDPRNQSLKYRRQSRAFDYTTTTRSGATNSLDSQPHSGSHGQSEQDSAASSGNCRENWTRTVAQSEEVSSSNKLRRLMFLSKTHQHHHIATSISSSTLMNNASFSGGTTSSNSGRRFSASQMLESSSLKLNSVSVDSGSQKAGNSNDDVRNDDADDSKETHPNCEELTSQNDLINRAQMRNVDQEGEGEAGFEDLCANSLPPEVYSQCQTDSQRLKTSFDSNKGTGKSEHTVVGLNEIEIKVQNSADNKPVEHHILIEPPSPPYRQQQAETSDLMAKSGKNLAQGNERLGSSEFDKTGERMTEFASRLSPAFSQKKASNSSELPEESCKEVDEEPSWLKSDDKTQITVREIKPPRLITPNSGMLTEVGPDKVASSARQQQQQQKRINLVIEQKQKHKQQQKRRSSESASQIRIQIETTTERQKGSEQDLRCDNEGWPESCGNTEEASHSRSQIGKQNEPKWKSRPEICFQEASPISFNKFDKFGEEEEDMDDDDGEERGEEQEQEQDDEDEDDDSDDSDDEMKNKGLSKKEREASKNKGSDTDDAFVKLAEYTARKHSRNAHTHSLSHTSVQLSQKGDYLRHQSFCAGVGIGCVPNFARCCSGCPATTSHIQTYGGSSRTIHTSNYPAATSTSTQQRQHRLHLAPACSCGSGNISNLDGQLRAPLLFETTDTNEDILPESDNNINDNNNLNTSDVQASGRGRISSVFAGSQYSRAHRDSFAMLRALSQKKSKSAEDVAYLSNLVLQIWVRDRNPLLQSASQQQLSLSRRQSSSQERNLSKQRRPKSSLNVSHL